MRRLASTPGTYPMMPHRSWLATLAGLLLLGAATAAQAADATDPLGVPQFDLADQSQLQVVVDREPGQYLGHPTTVLLEDGRTLWIVYPKGHGRGAIVLKRSDDGGLTWSERLPTPASWATSREVPTLFRTVDPAGRKRLIMFSGLYPIRLAHSDDDGATWSELAPIGDYGGIVACASVERLAGGEYLALFHDDGRFLTAAGRPAGAPPKFVVVQIVSRDGGLTWGPPRPIAAHPDAHLCEPGSVRSPDGKRITVLLRENSRRHHSFVIHSDDEGQTWSEPRELPAALTGDRHTCKYLANGLLFITFRDTLKESPSYGDWVAWVGTYDDLIAGRNGSFRVRLMDNLKGADCAYPPVEVLPDGTVVTTTYGHWTAGEEPYIVSVRLPRALLEKLHAEAQAARATDDRPATSGLPALEFRRLADLSDPRGVGGQFVGLSHGKLLLYGGTNFPDKPVWAGGVKAWYRDVHVLDAPEAAWRRLGPLSGDGPVGYGVSLPYDEASFACLGGADAARHHRTAFTLELDGERLVTRELPPLPEPRAYQAGARIGSIVYLVGGTREPDATRTTDTLWALDLKRPDAGWQVLSPLPGGPRMLPLVAADETHLYVSGGVDLSAGPDGKPVRRYLKDTYRYSPAGGWERRADAPASIVAAPTPAVLRGRWLLAFGGDDGSRLNVSPPESHPGFPRRTFAYDTAADRWSTTAPPAFVPVATPLVAWGAGYVVASGEIRPSVRSREVWWVAPTTPGP